MIRLRLREKLVVILVIIICLCILYISKVDECDVPLFIMRLQKTPIKFRKGTCPAEARHTSRNSDIMSQDKDENVPRYVVHAPMKGRIGNLMFQTASTFGIAATLKYKTYIPELHPLLHYFEMSPSPSMKLTNTINVTEEECMDSAWRCRKEIYSHNVTLHGFLQSWKYFRHIDQTIRKHFTIKSSYRDDAMKFLNSIRNRTVIGIHVRRGDFGKRYTSHCGYTMAAPDYFQKAMQLYRAEFKNAIFVVVSDSILWCKENIGADDVIYSNFRDPITDLALMSMCDHMIVSGGTYGFWGAWLAGGKVIYPKGWPQPGSWLDLYGMVVDDFWLPGWVGLSNSPAKMSCSSISIFITILLVRLSFL